MDLDYLTTFLEIAKQGSFSRAGQKLFRSQPAVSAQIRQLEEEYGQKLFDRVGKSMKLTAAGEVLLGYAGRLVSLKNESLRAVADQSSAPQGTLAVGANEATCLYVLPDVFSEFHRRFPSVQISVYRNFSRKVLEKVEDGALDVGIITLPVKSPSLKNTFDISRSANADGQPEKSVGATQDRYARRNRRPAADHSQDWLHAPVAGQIVSALPLAAPNPHGTPQRWND